jgi:acetyl-CoA acetyltransferase
MTSCLTMPAHANPNDGAIELRQPQRISGARLVRSAAQELLNTGASRALRTMCTGLGQGIALAIERI